MRLRTGAERPEAEEGNSLTSGLLRSYRFAFARTM
jgi:hypothetical protein